MIKKLNYLKEKKNLLKAINNNQESYYSKRVHFHYGLDYQKEISLYKVSGKFTLNEIQVEHNSYYSYKKYSASTNQGYENIHDFVDKSGYIKELWTNELNKKLTIYKENIQKEKFKNFNHIKYMEELKAHSVNIENTLRSLNYKTKEDIDKARNILWDVRDYFRDLENLEYKVNESNIEMQYNEFMNRYNSIKSQYENIKEKVSKLLC